MLSVIPVYGSPLSRKKVLPFSLDDMTGPWIPLSGDDILFWVFPGPWIPPFGDDMIRQDTLF
jgi:hypothetical protein